jgi:hypothetical protein
VAIPESQLDTWSGQGSVAQSKSTYASIKGVLESSRSPYATRDFDVFLQGSYANDTNVWAESDVDIVICLNSSFYYDIDGLEAAQQAEFHSAYPDGAHYGLPEFKQEVAHWLRAQYKSVVQPGAKAIFIGGYSNRRNTDVLVASALKRFSAFPDSQQQRFAEGIAFVPAGGGRIDNFPNQHSANCTSKHQGTGRYFKPMVRIFKNMRNRMVEDGLLGEGVAPSYYLEGLLYNVPDELYGGSFSKTFRACFDWLMSSNRNQLVCASELHWLLRDGRATSWLPANCDKFLTASREFWNQW